MEQGSLSAEFVSFEFIEDPKHVLSQQFLASSPRIANIIKNEKGVKLGFHKCKYDNVFIVMVKGPRSDHKLVELGVKYNFPRGFPVLWRPDVTADPVRYFGFLPKFENDDRQHIDKFTAEDNIRSIYFFKKWSGFLTQLIVWQSETGKRYWTVCSKNSASNDSIFIQDAHRLFAPLITDQLVSEMITENLHVCAEMMSKNDQVHGSRVLTETPVITVVGKRVPQNKKDSGFVEFLDHQSVVKFCVRNNLPCDSAISISGTESCISFLNGITLERDFFDNRKFDAFIAGMNGNVNILKGTVSHETVLGNCLEGLVLRMETNKGLITRKYKFPGYTIRTMLFRTEFENNITIGALAKEKARRFTEHWCVTDGGKKYWFDKALEGFIVHSTGSLQNNDQSVGWHIQLADYLETTQARDYDAIFDEQCKKSISDTVVIVIGPIGIGKSTVAAQLAKSIPNSIDIDGDDLGLGRDRTLRLGKERNDYTMSKIVHTLQRGKTPIISSGGGVFFTMKKKDHVFVLRDFIQKALGINVKIVVAIPSTDVNTFRPGSKFDADGLKKLYSDTQRVKSVVKQRIKEGKWSLPKTTSSATATKKSHGGNAKKNGGGNEKQQDEIKFAEFIANKSKQNLTFAMLLVESIADEWFYYPPIRTEIYDEQIKSLLLPAEASKKLIIWPNREDRLVARFAQVRVLVEITAVGRDDPFIGHVTYAYDEKRGTRYTLDDLRKIAVLGCYKGFIYTIPSDSDPSKTVSVAIPAESLHTDKRTHITVDAGNHEPRLMSDVSKAIVNNESSVTLQAKTGKLTYSTKAAKMTSCKIQYLDVFGI